MPENGCKTATLNLRIDPNLQEAAEKRAGANCRSIASSIEKLLSNWLRERNDLDGEQLRKRRGKR